MIRSLIIHYLLPDMHCNSQFSPWIVIAWIKLRFLTVIQSAIYSRNFRYNLRSDIIEPDQGGEVGEGRSHSEKNGAKHQTFTVLAKGTSEIGRCIYFASRSDECEDNSTIIDDAANGSMHYARKKKKTLAFDRLEGRG